MVVYNVNPEGSDPIIIIVKFEKSDDGSPGRATQQIMIKPGEGLELDLIGLSSDAPCK